ncbi:hypothetical protein PU1002_00025 [Candidatus Pelagibacter ubique HTCC1002]|uniref:Uncharacterized protein n=1 Tax=Pelagibacter ubique (strain HTCC1002) TaxID=314261 RepID=Q1UZY0_PELU1|nr:hypothetical protein PU1002_00025 [Candidatus Pelagibacter ubique HTCC1002]
MMGAVDKEEPLIVAPRTAGKMLPTSPGWRNGGKPPGLILQWLSDSPHASA